MAELLLGACLAGDAEPVGAAAGANPAYPAALALVGLERERVAVLEMRDRVAHRTADDLAPPAFEFDPEPAVGRVGIALIVPEREQARSEEHTSELQSLMRISYAVFCLKKKK